MGNGFGFILGGALAGVGGSIQDRVAQQKKERLLEIEHQNAKDTQQQAFQNETASNTQRHGFAIDEEGVRNTDELARQAAAEKAASDRADTEAGRRGDLADVEHQYRLDEDAAKAKRESADKSNDVTNFGTDANTDETVGFTRSGKVVRTGVKSGVAAEKRSAADDALLQRLERSHGKEEKTTDPETGATTTTRTLDNAAIANSLRKMGKPELAKEYDDNAVSPLKGNASNTDGRTDLRAGYASPDAVRADVKAGKLTKDKALQILTDGFGFEK